MASDDAVNQHSVEKSNQQHETTSTDRSLLDFMKKDDQDESKVITTEFDDKLHISNPQPEPKFEECKVEADEEEEEEEEEKVTKPSLLQKPHPSGSSSSSSSSEEEVEEEGVKIKKKKENKGLKEKIHKEEDTSVPVQVVTEPEEKKGFFEKIKDKVPGGDKKVEEETVAPTPAAPVEYDTVEGGEPPKKGIMERIKEKLPGGGHKVEEETNFPTPTPPLDHSPNVVVEGGEPAKKGIMDKIKDKLPGHHPKTTTEEEKKENDYA